MENKYFNNKKLVISIIWIIIGGTLFGLELAGIIESDIYSGIGGGLIGVGIVQLVRNIRYRNDKEYKNKIDIEANDERNGYIRSKAWAWTGYIFVMGAAIVALVMFITGNKEIGQIISFCMCAELVVYYVSYIILKRKY